MGPRAPIVVPRSRWLAAAGGVLVLVALRTCLHAPRQLIAVAAVSLALVLLLDRRRRKAGAFSAAAFLLALWLVTTALALASTFWIDPGGWLFYRISAIDYVLPQNRQGDVSLSTAEFLARNPQFSLDSSTDHGVRLKSGVHDVVQTVVIPRGTRLTVDPGTTLRFAAGQSLVVYGTLIARGLPAAPIFFLAQDSSRKWGSLGIIDGHGSWLEYVHLKDARNAVVNRTSLLGGLSVIGGDAVIRSSEFMDAAGRDAVSIRAARIDLQANIFRKSRRDCLDVDGGSGTIRGNLFVNCGDEAIDLGGNYQVEVTDNRILDPRGGRIGAEKGMEGLRSSNSFGYALP